MGYGLDAGGQGRLGSYFSEIGVALSNKTRRAAFSLYAMGLLGKCRAKERRADCGDDVLGRSDVRADPS